MTAPLLTIFFATHTAPAKTTSFSSFIYSLLYLALIHWSYLHLLPEMPKTPAPKSVASRASGRLTEKRLKASKQPPAPADQSADTPPPKTAPGPASIPDSCSETSSSSELDSSSSEESPRERNPGPAQNQNKGPRASPGRKSSPFAPPSRCFKISVPW